jgi:flagellar basal body P-ring formation protein FlgA
MLRTRRSVGALLRRATLVAIAGCPAACADAFAQESLTPMPRAVIYPGDIIRDDMLIDTPIRDPRSAPGALLASRADLIGKTARATLLPGRTIPLSAIANRRLVVNGAEVRLVYIEGGLTIVTTGAAMQDGAIGDEIKVRNSDSGVTVTGAVQPDGSVRVSGV